MILFFADFKDLCFTVFRFILICNYYCVCLIKNSFTYFIKICVSKNLPPIFIYINLNYSSITNLQINIFVNIYLLFNDKYFYYIKICFQIKNINQFFYSFLE